MPSIPSPSTPSADLPIGPAAERAWDELRSSIDLASGFWFGWVFADSMVVRAVLAERTERVLRRDGRHLRRLRWRDGDPAADLLSWAAAGAGPHEIGWLEIELPATAPEDVESTWPSALARLNERRNRLVEAFPGGLVIAAPTQARLDLRDRAPDLWSIRNVSFEASGVLGNSAPRAASVDGRAETDEASDVRDLGLDLAQLIAPPGRIDGAAGVHLRAAEAALAHGQWVQAAAEARSVLDVGDPEARNTRAQANGIIALAAAGPGDVEIDAGRAVEAALAALRSSAPLGAGRAVRLLKLIGDLDDRLTLPARRAEVAAEALRAAADPSPERLRDHSISLNRLGDIHQQLGELDNARTNYQHALDLTVQLRDRHGDTPERLRDHSLSLNRLGDIHQQLGELDDAIGRYDESLPIARLLAERYPMIPQFASDLAVTERRLAELHTQTTA